MSWQQRGDGGGGGGGWGLCEKEANTPAYRGRENPG